MPANVNTALSERSKEVVAAINSWDCQDIMELHGLLQELRKIVALFDQDPTWYVSREDIPSVPLPPGMPVESIWGCDLNGICLVKHESEFSFKARVLADLAPRVDLDPSVAGSLEILKGAKKKRITIQVTQREYAGILRAMLQDEEPKIAAWLRKLVIKELDRRGIKF